MVMINSVQGNLPASVIPRHAIGDRSTATAVAADFLSKRLFGEIR
jgi:hypothetical protein